MLKNCWHFNLLSLTESAPVRLFFLIIFTDILTCIMDWIEIKMKVENTTSHILIEGSQVIISKKILDFFLWRSILS